MRYFTITFIVFLFALASAPVCAYEYGDPTSAEQAHLEYINWARAKPYEVTEFYGLSSLVEGVPAGEISGVPAPPITLNKLLSDAAYNHSMDMAVNNYFQHDSNDGRDPFERIENTGYQYWAAGENIAMTASTTFLEEVNSSLRLHEVLFVDEGYPGRGHRVNILSPDFKEVGIGLYGGPSYSYPYSYFVTTDFASSSTDNRCFVLGVIYEDKDQNGYYTAGEGIGGVSIREENTGETTTSASAGGYAIPFSPGAYTFVFTHPRGSVVSKAVSISGENIKVDLTLADFANSLPQTERLTQTEVSQLYIGVFGRASEGSGNSYWQTDPSSTSMTATANIMLNTVPAKTYFGSTLSNNQAFIKHIYSNTLGKTYEEDPDGVNYWVNELVAGKSKGQVVATLINAAIDPQYAGLAAQDQFLNKVKVSNYTADTIALVPDVNDLSAFVDFVKGVTDDPATVVAAQAAVDSF